MTDELYHHGILGMKWGIRRYQNADGTLTPKGKKRYDKFIGSRKEAKLEKKLKKIEQKYGNNNSHIKKIEQKYGNDNSRFKKLEQKYANDSPRFKKLEQKSAKYITIGKSFINNSGMMDLNIMDMNIVIRETNRRAVQTAIRTSRI